MLIKCRRDHSLKLKVNITTEISKIGKAERWEIRSWNEHLIPDARGKTIESLASGDRNLQDKNNLHA